MRLATLAALGVMSATLCASGARAQPVPGEAEARTLTECLHRHVTELERIVRLIDEAHARERADMPEDVRRDARTAIEALVARAHAASVAARQCLSATHVPSAHAPAPAHADHERADRAADSVAAEHGTVHEIESGQVLTSRVRAVRGERVDGRGSAPDASVRRAVRTIAGGLAACYDAYVDRASRATGELHLVFEVVDGGRVSNAQIEGAGGFDATMRTCVTQAASGMRVERQRGEATYSYTLRFGE